MGNSRHNGTGAGGALTAFVVGGVMGASIALLFAPQRGKKLRTDISEKVTNLVQDGEHALRSASNTVTTAAREIERKAEKLL